MSSPPDDGTLKAVSLVRPQALQPQRDDVQLSPAHVDESLPARQSAASPLLDGWT